MDEFRRACRRRVERLKGNVTMRRQAKIAFVAGVVGMGVGGVIYRLHPVRSIEAPRAIYSLDAHPVFSLFANLDPVLLPHRATIRPFVWDVVAPTRAEVAHLLGALRALYPAGQFGRYVSATGAVAAGSAEDLAQSLRRFVALPAGSLLASGWDEYGVGCVRRADLRDPAVRAKMIDFWLEAFRAGQWTFLAGDNFLFRFGDEPVAGYWDACIELLRDYRRRGDVPPLYLNVASYAAETWPELIPLVDGLMMEFALHDSGPVTPADLLRRYRIEFASYRAALDAGKTVLLVKGDGPDIRHDGRILSAAVCLLRHPGEPIYFNPDTARRRDYVDYQLYDWWRQLGVPKGPLGWVEERCIREFEHGRVELDVSTAPAKVRVEFH